MKTERMLSGGYRYPASFGVVDGAWDWMLFLPEIEFPDLSLPDSVRKEAKRNEQIIAYYNADGTVTCEHKRDGRVVDSKTVKRYHKDADDLRVATKCALGKMLGGQEKGTQEFYRPGDRVLVRDDLVQYKEYGGLGWLPGMNEEISGVVTLGRKTPLGNFQVRGWCISPEMLAGKIVPLDGLKAGDDVLAKDEQFLGPTHDGLANKVLKISYVDGDGDAWAKGHCFTPSKRFVGKLLRAPSKE